jgi:hypothetical protein
MGSMVEPDLNRQSSTLGPFDGYELGLRRQKTVLIILEGIFGRQLLVFVTYSLRIRVHATPNHAKRFYYQT